MTSFHKCDIISSVNKEKVYDLYKIAEGTDKNGDEFMTVLISLRKTVGSEAVAVFNHPHCSTCSAGMTWRSNVKTLEFFLGGEFKSVMDEVKRDGYSCVVVGKNDKGERTITALLRRFPKEN